jgi:hypothetical protein
MYGLTKQLPAMSALLLATALCSTAQAQGLFIDFNSTTQDGGPTNNVGYEAYDAGHEVAADFVTQNFSAFGTTIGVTPAWPNSTANTVQQMIDRGSGNDVNWLDTDIDLVTDWLGIDTRTGNGGNGDWDGTTGTPTYMTLALSGLPASPNLYQWKSYHHDTEHVHGNFAVWLSTDGGANFEQLPDGYFSDSTPAGTPDSAVDGSPGLVTDFAGMTAAGSIYETEFAADGVNDVVLRFAVYSGVLGAAVHNQLFGINGFDLVEGFVAGDVNNDQSVNRDDFDIISGNFGLSPATREEGNIARGPDVNVQDVNLLDFREWKRNLPAANGAIPEPTGIMLAVCGLLAGAASSRRRRRMR